MKMHTGKYCDFHILIAAAQVQCCMQYMNAHRKSYS